MSWHIEGEYQETCNCTFLCPCITSNLQARPTEGDCKAALALRIERGEKEGVSLDGLNFIILMRSPGPMAEGKMKVGVIVDDRASEEQVQAIADIASGAAGGPMAGLAPLVSDFAGVEQRPIIFGREGLKRSVQAGELVEQSLEGLESAADPSQAMEIHHTAHPVSPNLALARAWHSRFHAFGIEWNDDSGTRNGHFAHFSWSG